MYFNGDTLERSYYKNGSALVHIFITRFPGNIEMELGNNVITRRVRIDYIIMHQCFKAIRICIVTKRMYIGAIS